MAQNETFSVKEKLAIHILLFILKMAQPFRYEHEFKEALKPIEDLIAKKGE